MLQRGVAAAEGARAHPQPLGAQQAGRKAGGGLLRGALVLAGRPEQTEPGAVRSRCERTGAGLCLETCRGTHRTAPLTHSPSQRGRVGRKVQGRVPLPPDTGRALQRGCVRAVPGAGVSASASGQAGSALTETSFHSRYRQAASRDHGESDLASVGRPEQGANGESKRNAAAEGRGGYARVYF